MSGADINSLQEPTRLILAAIPRGKSYNYPSYSDKLSGSLGSHSWDRQRWDGVPGSLTLPPAGLPAMPTHLVQVANWFVQKPRVSQSQGPGGKGERVPRELRSDEVVPRSHQSLKEEQATPMWRASSPGQPGHFLQCNVENPTPATSIATVAGPTLGRCHSEGQELDYESLWLLWPPPRAWASHPGQCCWTEQELHHSLQEPHGDRERVLHYLKVPEIPDSTRCPAREDSQVPPLTSLPAVTSVSFLL